jgi:hypothetical protein
VAEKALWVRSVCPWDTALSPNEFEAVGRATYDNASMLEGAAGIPQLLSEEGEQAARVGPGRRKADNGKPRPQARPQSR